MELEAAANRWAVLFYAHQALRAFRAGNSQDFRQLRDVLTGTPSPREARRGRQRGVSGEGRPRREPRSSRNEIRAGSGASRGACSQPPGPA